jgi:hypothetical protein
MIIIYISKSVVHGSNGSILAAAGRSRPTENGSYGIVPNII